MSTTINKQILCLANSRKYGGRCVVGKEVLADRTLVWVRPVGSSPTGEVMPDEMCFEDESLPQLLDVIEVPLLEPNPLPYQPENWLAAPEPWTRLRVADKANIERWLDAPAPLWENGHDTAQGTNDRFPYVAGESLEDSARFVSVPSLDITVSDRKDDEGAIKRQLRGSFAHAGDVYGLASQTLTLKSDIQKFGLESSGLAKPISLSPSESRMSRRPVGGFTITSSLRP